MIRAANAQGGEDGDAAAVREKTCPPVPGRGRRHGTGGGTEVPDHWDKSVRVVGQGGYANWELYSVAYAPPASRRLSWVPCSTMVPWSM